MPFRMAFNEAEGGGELSLQRFGVVAHNMQTAASGRAKRPECAKNEMASGLYRGSGVLNVIHALAWAGEKVKHSAIVP
jgi:hypothetical protein